MIFCFFLVCEKVASVCSLNEATPHLNATESVRYTQQQQHLMGLKFVFRKRDDDEHFAALNLCCFFLP